MKKFLVATLLVAGTSMALFSCSNGAYDAHPDTDLSSGKNPLDPNSGVSVYLGTMKGRVNKKELLFTNARWDIYDTANLRVIMAQSFEDPKFQKTIGISVQNNSENYKGPKVYNIGADAFAWSFNYTVKDTGKSAQDIASYAFYGPSNDGRGLITFDLKGDEGQNLRGVFSGTVYRYYFDLDNPNDPTNIKEFDMTDSVVFENMEFYIPRVPLSQW